MQDLARSVYVCEDEDANEVDDCIGALSRYVSHTVCWTASVRLCGVAYHYRHHRSASAVRTY